LKFLAQIISFIFHPLLLPTFAFMYVMHVNPEKFSGIDLENASVNLTSSTNLLLIQVFINSFFFPAISILIMKGLGMINSIYMKTREERYPEILSDIMLATLFGLVIAFISNALKLKISLHAIGGGIFFALAILSVGFSSFDALPYLLGIIFICGLIGSARLLLNAHTTKELYAGFIAGMLCMNFAFLF